MATVKEVKLMKDGAMVTSVTLVDSVKNLDGTSYKETVNSSLNSINSSLNSVNSSLGQKADKNHSHLSNTIFTETKSSTSDITSTLPELSVGQIGFFDYKHYNDRKEENITSYMNMPNGTYIVYYSLYNPINTLKYCKLVNLSVGQSISMRVTFNDGIECCGMYMRVS